MQKAIFGMETMNCTQGMNIGTHLDSYAMDFAGEDNGIDYIMAPFTGKVVKTYEADANEVWLESIEPVLFADGTVDYMVMMACHDYDISNLYIGQIIEQGNKDWYCEGNKGQSSGNHVHIECAKGKFDGIGWHHNIAGYWSINNGYELNKCLFVPSDFNIISDGGVEWTRTDKWIVEETKNYIGNPLSRNELVDQVEVLQTVSELYARKSPNGDILGYIKPGIYNLLDKLDNGNYTWLNIENDMWIAYNEEWETIYPKKEEPVIPDLKDYEKLYNEELKKNSELVAKNDSLMAKNEELNMELSKYTFITKILKNDMYAIKLYNNESLYIKKD